MLRISQEPSTPISDQIVSPDCPGCYTEFQVYLPETQVVIDITARRLIVMAASEPDRSRARRLKYVLAGYVNGTYAVAWYAGHPVPARLV